MGGEISIRDKEPGEAGTCFGFNVFLKASKSPEVEDNLEEGRAAPSLFREPACLRADTASSSSTATRPAGSCTHGWRASG